MTIQLPVWLGTLGADGRPASSAGSKNGRAHDRDILGGAKADSRLL